MFCFGRRHHFLRPKSESNWKNQYSTANLTVYVRSGPAVPTPPPSPSTIDNVWCKSPNKAKDWVSEPQLSGDAMGMEFWLQWQVLACALVFIIPTAVSLKLIISAGGGREEVLKSADLWMPCWRNLHPRWLLFYRAFAFASMAFLLYQTVVTFGSVVFLFYTQWTFALVLIYFALGTIISARGCYVYSKNASLPNEGGDKFLKNVSDPLTNSNRKDKIGSIKLESHHNQMLIDQRAGFWDNVMLIIYQISAGASMLTDIVFWCLLLPFQTGDNFTLTMLIGCMHSVNAIFLLLDSALNSLPFSWYKLTYFVLWSTAYIVFLWVLYACGSSWWPYAFLELATPWAPVWFLGIALVHIPCYGFYVMLVRAKGSIFSRMFPQSFVRTVSEKKQI